MRLNRVALIVLLASALVACSSSGSSSNGPPPEGTGGQSGAGGEAGTGGGTQAGDCASHNGDDLDATCDAFATTLCAYRARCTTSLAYFKSQASCVAVEKAACMNEAQLPGTAMTAGAVWLATKAYSTETCLLQDVSADTSCPATGTLADGTACAASFQCASGYCKSVVGTYSCGQCASLVAESGSCEKNADCASGLWCNKGTCAKTTADGAACQVTDECNDRSLCSGGKCTPSGEFSKSAGESCQADWQCVRGLACVQFTCAEPVFASQGESCGMDSRCGNGLICDQGTCAPYVPGASCSSSMSCLMGQYCNGGTCVDQGELGGACAINGLDDDCVLGLTCVFKKCGFLDASVCN